MQRQTAPSYPRPCYSLQVGQQSVFLIVYEFSCKAQGEPKDVSGWKREDKIRQTLLPPNPPPSAFDTHPVLPPSAILFSLPFPFPPMTPLQSSLLANDLLLQPSCGSGFKWPGSGRIFALLLGPLCQLDATFAVIKGPRDHKFIPMNSEWHTALLWESQPTTTNAILVYNICAARVLFLIPKWDKIIMRMSVVECRSELRTMERQERETRQ